MKFPYFTVSYNLLTWMAWSTFLVQHNILTVINRLSVTVLRHLQTTIMCKVAASHVLKWEIYCTQEFLSVSSIKSNNLMMLKTMHWLITNELYGFNILMLLTFNMLVSPHNANTSKNLSSSASALNSSSVVASQTFRHKFERHELINK